MNQQPLVCDNSRPDGPIGHPSLTLLRMNVMMNALTCCYLDSPEVPAMTNYADREAGLSLVYSACQFNTRLALYKPNPAMGELQRAQGQVTTAICFGEAAD